MRFSLALIVACSVAGCADRLAHVRTSASTSLLCREDEIVVRQHRPRVYSATGCGREGLLQCRETGHPRCFDLMQLARERASRERSCPMEQVSVAELSPFVFVTTACGARATYHCEHLGQETRCLLESREEEATDAPEGEQSTEVQLL